MSGLTTRTRAAVWRGDSQLVLESWELPGLGDDDLLVEVSGCGVCGSDLHVLDGGFPWLEPPLVLGHEPAGRIAAIGSAVTGFEIGEAVTWEPNVTCGRCFQCREGEDANACENRVRVSGSYADHTVVPARALHRLPAGCDRRAAILAEPLACALYAFDRGAVRLGHTVAVIGAGTIGLLLVWLARRAGAKRVVVSDPNPLKRAAAERLGADLAVDPGRQPFADIARSDNAAGGFDVAFEAVGKPSSIRDGLAAARPGGQVVLVGMSDPGDAVSLDLLAAQRRDLTISTCFLRRHTFQRAVDLLPSLPVADLVTHELRLEEVAEGVRLVREGEAIKVMVVP